MAELKYSYTPLYGCEPYLDNNGAGGALVTGNNLIITLWSVSAVFLPVDFLSLLKPNSVNDLAAPAQRTAALQAAHSRHSARFFFNPASYGSFEEGDTVWPLMAVVNPPPELKQQLVGAVEFNGGDPSLITNYNVKKSLQGLYFWTGSPIAGTFEPNYNVWGGEGWSAAFSDYIPLFNNPIEPIPFLATNGADGSAPTFFDRSTVQGVNQMIEAVNDGAFYIAYFFGTFLFGENTPGWVDFRWPHSAARA